MIDAIVKNWYWFLICTFTSCLYGFMPYSDALKRSPYYMYIGLATALLSNTCWLLLAKGSHSNTETLYAGIIWDILIMVPFLVLGLVCNAQALSATGIVGIILVFAGLICIKL